MQHPVHNMAYISGPLTELTAEQRDRLYPFYIRLGETCQEFGLFGFVPHLHSDPLAMKSLQPADIDRQDRFAVNKSRIVIAYVGIPSTGVGIEIEMAYHARIPVILLFEREVQVSRLVLGAPAVTNTIAFLNDEDAFVRLRLALREFCHRDEIACYPAPLQFNGNGKPHGA